MTLKIDKRPAKTRGYQPLQSWWLRRHQKLPLLTFPIIEMMLCDETIQIGLAARRAVLQGVDFGYDKDGTWSPGVECANAMVGEWVMRQVKKLWSCAIEHIASAQVYGWAGMEVVWERSPETNLWEISGIEERHANDTRVIISGDTGRPCGVRFMRIVGAENGYLDLHFPESFFHAYNPNPGERYGHTVLHGSYRSWADKHLDGGAVDVRRLFMHKDAYGGADLSYPEGSTDIGTLDFPNEVPNRELAREIVEQIESGGVTTTPSQYDDKGNPLWKLTRATVPSNPAHILQYPGDLDGEMLRGMYVPDGVLKADDTGSWQGRLIPMGILYANLDPWVGSILRDIREQLLEPGILNNWGMAIPFNLEHRPLADQALEQQKQQQPSTPGMGPGAGGPEDLMGMLGMGQDPNDPDGQGPEGDDPGDDDDDDDDDDDPTKPKPKRMALDPVEAVGEGVLSARSLVEAARAALRMGPTEDDDEEEDPAERAAEIADILTHIFGDEAESHFDEVYGVQRMASWNSIDHPRGPNGRFIAKNSPEAFAAASDKIGEALKGGRTPESLKTITEHLSILTGKQLQDLKKKYNLSASAKTKASLVAKLADRLDRGRREEPEAKPQEEEDLVEQVRKKIIEIADKYRKPDSQKEMESFLAWNKFPDFGQYPPNLFENRETQLKASEELRDWFHEQDLEVPDSMMPKSYDDWNKNFEAQRKKRADKAKEIFGWVEKNKANPVPLEKRELEQHLAWHHQEHIDKLTKVHETLKKLTEAEGRARWGTPEDGKKWDNLNKRHGNKVFKDLEALGYEYEAYPDNKAKQIEHAYSMVEGKLWRLNADKEDGSSLEKYYESPGRAQAILDHKAALQKHVENGGELTPTQLRENIYEPWINATHKFRAETLDYLDANKRYLAREHIFVRGILNKKMKAAAPKIEELFNKASKASFDNEEGLKKINEERNANIAEMQRLKQKALDEANENGKKPSEETLNAMRAVTEKSNELLDKLQELQSARKRVILDAIFGDKFEPVKFDVEGEIPEELQKQLDRAGKFLGQVAGGHLKKPVRVRVIPPIEEQRAYCNHDGTIHLSVHNWASTVAHECGHTIDTLNNNRLGALGKAFVSQRIDHAGEEVKHLGEGYRSYEIAAKDHFQSPYSGKFYPQDASEVLSMGVQYLIEDPKYFMETDPEHFRYTVAALKGLI